MNGHSDRICAPGGPPRQAPSRIDGQALSLPRHCRWGSSLLALLWLLGGCSGGIGGDFDPTQSESLNVRLFLYPPETSGVPIQMTIPVDVVSDTTGVVQVDPGVEVTGSLVLETAVSRPLPLESGVAATVLATDRSTGLTYKTQTTTENPTFSLQVPSGTYDLFISPRDEGTPFPPQQVQDVQINARAAGDLGLAPLDAGVPVQVVLTDTEGQALLGATVYTLSTQSGLKSSTALSATGDGAYWIQVAQGQHELWLGPGTAQTVPTPHQWLGVISSEDASQEAQAISVETHVQRLTGRVVDALNAPVGSANIFATRQSDALEGTYTTSTTTSEQGEFSLLLPHGFYDLVIRPSSRESSGQVLSGTLLTLLPVSSDQPVILGDVVLRATVEVRGRVVGSDNAAISGASVTLSSVDKANYGSSALTDEAGAFTLATGSGLFTLDIDPPDGQDLVRSVNTLTVPDGGLELGDLALEAGFASSFVFEVEEIPLPGMWVEVWTATESDVSSSTLLFDTVTDAAGQARLVLPFGDSSLLRQAGASVGRDR